MEFLIQHKAKASTRIRGMNCLNNTVTKCKVKTKCSQQCITCSSNSEISHHSKQLKSHLLSHGHSMVLHNSSSACIFLNLHRKRNSMPVKGVQLKKQDSNSSIKHKTVRYWCNDNCKWNNTTEVKINKRLHTIGLYCDESRVALALVSEKGGNCFPFSASQLLFMQFDTIPNKKKRATMSASEYSIKQEAPSV